MTYVPVQSPGVASDTVSEPVKRQEGPRQLGSAMLKLRPYLAIPTKILSVDTPALVIIDKANIVSVILTWLRRQLPVVQPGLLRATKGQSPGFNAVRCYGILLRIGTVIVPLPM